MWLEVIWRDNLSGGWGRGEFFSFLCISFAHLPSERDGREEERKEPRVFLALFSQRPNLLVDSEVKQKVLKGRERIFPRVNIPRKEGRGDKREGLGESP